LVAFEDEAPVGSISLLPDDPPAPLGASPWLASFYVRPDRRGCGIGGRLHQALVDAARAAGLSFLHLWTPDAAGWYEARGWSPVGRFEAFGVESRILRIELTRPLP
jgi:GNAT superfamily N-acetyltransferase